MKLLDQVRAVIRKKHYSIRTEQAYVAWTKRFTLFHGKRHPKDMGEEGISQYISHLATDQKVAASTQNQALPSPMKSAARELAHNFGDLKKLMRKRGHGSLFL